MFAARPNWRRFVYWRRAGSILVSFADHKCDIETAR
jgi:hypothetical protein